MRMLSLDSLLALVTTASAQSCGALAISGGTAGASVAIALSAAPAGGYVVLAVGEQAGSTVVPLPLGGSLVLGVAAPFVPMPIGVADASGNLAVAVPVPANLPRQLQLQVQAAVVQVAFPPLSLSACASNVVPVTIG